ncbi:Diphthamide biosynthesis protein 2 [Thecaphora frezii]
MAAFSTTDAAIITHEVQLDAVAQSATAASSGRSIYDVYDVHQTAAKVVERRFRNVALQFPDEALIDSVPVYWALRRETRSLCRDRYPEHQLDGVLPKFYILADTSYGSCCVDEVAAQHVDADLVVHYGHACLSPTARLPVIYVFTKQPVDVDEAAKSLSDAAHSTFFDSGNANSSAGPSALVFTYDVAWAHAAEGVYAGLASKLKEKGVEVPVVMTEIDTRRNYEDKLANVARGNEELSIQDAGESCCRRSGDPAQAACCSSAAAQDGAPPPSNSACCSSGGGSGGGPACLSSSQPSSANRPPPPASQPSVEEQRRESPLGPSRSLHLPEGVPLSACAFAYLGPESLSLTNLLLLLGPSKPFLSYNPLTGTSRTETGRTNRLLMKRYTHVLKARDASVVGLLVGTLGVHSYLPLLSHLRSLLTAKRSGRKVYTISVGKLNPAKLANFQEIDVFVLVACPENSLVDSKDFYKPIVTPYEMELALKAQGDDVAWTGDYVLDLDRLVPDEVKRKAGEDALAKPGTQDRDSQADEGQGQEVEEEEGEDNEGQDADSDDDDEPHFSLITGTYVHRRRYGVNATASTAASAPAGSLELMATGAAGGPESHTVALCNADGTLTTVLQSASTAHLEARGWKGLEQRLGLDQPAKLEEGNAGIAKGYQGPDGVREGRRTQPTQS